MQPTPRPCLYCVYHIDGGCWKRADGYCMITKSTRIPTEDEYTKAREGSLET